MIRIAFLGMGRRSGPGLWGVGLFEFWGQKCDTYGTLFVDMLILPSVFDVEVGFFRYVLHFGGWVGGMAWRSGPLVFLTLGRFV